MLDCSLPCKYRPPGRLTDLPISGSVLDDCRPYYEHCHLQMPKWVSAGIPGEAEAMSIEEFRKGCEDAGIFYCPLCHSECTHYTAGMQIKLQFTMQNGKLHVDIP